LGRLKNGAMVKNGFLKVELPGLSSALLTP